MKRFLLDIPFNHPYETGREFQYIREAIEGLQLSGNGPFGKRCSRWLEQRTGCVKALLTHSCTGALELAAILAEVSAGDEVIMPSFTFPSTANAFVLRGAVPVFVDIRADTFNLDESLVEGAVTSRTRAIVPVHYAGVACEMDELERTAKRHNLLLIEDAAQAILARYRDRPLGSIGRLGAVSFHETKNLLCGEGGALLINDEDFTERAEVVQEKGTDRSRLFRGEIDRYTWIDIGSSFLLSEINAGFLWAQLEEADTILARRLEIWNAYDMAFKELEREGDVRRPRVPSHCKHNGHAYTLLLPDEPRRDGVIGYLRQKGIAALSHYMPLHSSRAGSRYARAHGDLRTTDDVSKRLVRLPLWLGMSGLQIEQVVAAVQASVHRPSPALRPAR
jgi:dTDP-4-amino-4,6-dideoxygalactose transaminase